MLQHADYVMINVSDMGRSIAFYRDRLGLPLKFESPGWSEFATGTTTIALHHVERPASKEGAQGGAPQAGTCTIGFSVADLDATHVELTRRGVPFVMPPTSQPAEGIRLAVCVDPDGLAISFAQPT